jgi:ABC-2 type transport system ATP-binding protein
MSLGPRISLRNASRWYGQVIGLNDVSCEIGPGVTALLGMNGAGKSTMLRLITGQIRPTTGEVFVYEQEPFANPEVFKHLGYCPEIDNFYEHNTGRRFIYHLARLNGFQHNEAISRTEEVLITVGMHERADRKIAGYSKGMRQRIKLAQAMLNDPDMILLDEPLNGLDPMARREYIDLLHALANQGKTILVSSHILFEVEQMTRSILLLHRGRLLASGDLKVIRELMDKYPHRVRLTTTDAHRIGSQLAGLPYILSLEYVREGIELQVKDPSAFYDYLANLMLEEDASIEAFSSPDNNLESIFRYLVNA